MRDRQKDRVAPVVRLDIPLTQSLVWGLQAKSPVPLRMLRIELEQLAHLTLHNPET